MYVCMHVCTYENCYISEYSKLNEKYRKKNYYTKKENGIKKKKE